MTVTATPTLQTKLDTANANNLADLLALVKLGTVLAPLKRAFTGLGASASFDLTAIDGTGETVGASNANRLAALCVTALRCTASGTANSVGSYGVTDTGGTAVTPTAGANLGVAKISDDGKTITFLTTVTGFTIEYIPRSHTAMTTVEEGFGDSP
jgi:hypothetical protein